jgi:hypothetical protein
MKLFCNKQVNMGYLLIILGGCGRGCACRLIIIPVTSVSKQLVIHIDNVLMTMHTE